VAVIARRFQLIMELAKLLGGSDVDGFFRTARSM
jgi:hypothetical protein